MRDHWDRAEEVVPRRRATGNELRHRLGCPLELQIEPCRDASSIHDRSVHPSDQGGRKVRQCDGAAGHVPRTNTNPCDGLASAGSGGRFPRAALNAAEFPGFPAVVQRRIPFASGPSVPTIPVTTETFTAEETRTLTPYFTNTVHPVFGLVNLPEAVKGALFARYSRSAKSLRRLFLDEFLPDLGARGHAVATPRDVPVAGVERADRLYARVLNEFGDDSVAQLGAAHLACEGVSNILTKVLERGRLMAYLEQSTRYVPYTDRPGGRWKYHVPAELDGSPLRATFVRTLDEAFDTYARWIPPLEAHFRARYPKSPQDSDAVYRSVIRAKALDTLRGLLPAATTSNVGLFGTGQAFEALLLRMFAHPLLEVRAYANLMLAELRKIVPAFLTRIDQPERGVRWVEYLSRTRQTFGEAARGVITARPVETTDEVTLTDFDPDGELKVVAAALYAHSSLSDRQLLEQARLLSADERTSLLTAYVGQRTNRRHKPGRAFERTSYRFDVLTDYGAFRDLQRHRLLTIDWQPLSTRHRFMEPAAVEEAGAHVEWRSIMSQSAELYDQLVAAGLRDVAPYAVPMAYRVRFYMEMNAREAMHVIELRTSPQGHPAYRRVCQAMHRAIAEVAGHRAIAAAMQFADHSEVELERLQSERAMERKRRR
jgi:thymidylate synthase ThyX